MRHLLACFLALLAFAGPAHAQSADDLLPVEQAFKLTANLAEPGRIALHWDIAPDYYLYRSRIKAKTTQTGVTLGDLTLPSGIRQHDEFFGDVEIYHRSLDATLPYTWTDAAAKTLTVTITAQGCHEVDPKICYPPHPTTVTLDVPAASAAPAGSTQQATPSPPNSPGPQAQPSGVPQRADQRSANAPPHPLEGEGFNSATPAPSAAPLINLGGALGGGLNRGPGEPLPPEQAFVFEAIAQSPTSLLARWTMPKGYYLYRDKSVLRVGDGAGVSLGAPSWPPGVEHRDEHFGTVQVFFNEVELPLTLLRENGAPQTVTLHAEYQGCQDDGICYPVIQRDLAIALPAATAEQLAAARAAFIPATNTATTASVAGNDQSEEQILAENLSGQRLLTLLSFFGFGLLLAFTPCVFPMIPILSGIIAGAGENVSTRRAFVLSVVYVLATCVVFTIAGVVAGLAGANLQAAFQKPWILISFAAVFVLLSLSMFGFYELQLPASWQNRLAGLSNRQKSGSLTGVAVMGVLSALIVGPCVAPPLAAAVLYISQTRDPVFGGLALFVLSAGMGAPLVVFGTAAGKLLPRAGAWMNAVKAVFGVLFLALAIWMLSRILDGVWVMLMSGALMIAAAVYLGALERLAEGASGWRKLWKAFGVILLLLGATQLIGAAAGGNDITRPLATLGGGGGGSVANTGPVFQTIKSSADLDRELAAAASRNQRVMLDFYADWCVSCKEMDAFTFTSPEVHTALDGVLLLKADVTANDASDQELLKRFQLFGPPAILFFADGAELRAQRLIGFEKSAAFVDRVARASAP